MIDIATHHVLSRIDVGRNVEDFFSPILLSPDGLIAYLVIDSHVVAFDISTGRQTARAACPGCSAKAWHSPWVPARSSR